MKTKYIKRRGHAYAVVRSPKSVAHLNPQSLTHSVHKEFARQLKDRTDGRILVDISPKEKLKFPSLENGVMLDAHGRGISGMQFEGILNQCRWERGHYLANETSRSGKPYARKRQVDPVRQMSISAFPAHALAFSAMELAGAPCASIVAAAAFALGEAFQWQTPYELLAMAIHPEESTLHFHLHYSVVNAGNRLLHEGSQLGQPARNLLGVGRIGTLRLVEFKFWPEADALDIRQTLKTKTDKFGAVPIDWLLAETLDGTWEQFFKLSKDPKVCTAYEIAMQLYRERSREVRQIRPDMLIAENARLHDESESLRKENHRFKRPPSTPQREPGDTINILSAIVQLLPKLFRQEPVPPALKACERFLTTDSSGSMQLSRSLVERVDSLLVPSNALRDALTEACQAVNAYNRADHERSQKRGPSKED